MDAAIRQYEESQAKPCGQRRQVIVALALQLAVNACGLPKDEVHHMGAIPTANPPNLGYWRWTVRPVAIDGKLTPVLAGATDRPERTDE